MKTTRLVISTLTALLLGATAQAGMITVGGDQTAGTGTLTVNNDLTFNITSNATQIIFVFDEIVQADGVSDVTFFNGLQYSINGGTPLDLNTWVDNLAQIDGSDVTPNDGYFFGNASSVTAGDTVTLLAGTGTMTQTQTTFNPWSSGDYNVFLVDGTGNTISGVIPEPSVIALVGVFGGALFGVRRIFMI